MSPPPVDAVRFFDAHNHLQDDRFGGIQEELVASCRAAGVVRMVVNGSCPEDWPAVEEMARRFPDVVIPAFGVHPWYVHQLKAGWRDGLQRYLDTSPGAVMGEIGLDRWILDCRPEARAAVSPGLAGLQAASLGQQAEAFVWQLGVAAERGISASIHCLQAWGPLHDVLRAGPRPAAWLLHSYGGSHELAKAFAQLGAYFSFPGYFLHPRKTRQREVFQAIPLERLLAETDAPDQLLPAALEGGDPPAEIAGPEGRPLNHPVNIRRVVEGLARVRSEHPEHLASALESNFRQVFPF